jgi:hypothetical protein
MDMPRITRRSVPPSFLPVAALVLLSFAPYFSEAQERVGGGARGAAPVFKQAPSDDIHQTVSLRIYPKSADEAVLLKESLVRQPGVSDVKLSEDLRTLSCTYLGVTGNLPKLEAKSSGSLLSPAKIVLSLSRNPARARCATCGVDEHLRAAGGVSSVVVNGGRAELYADLGLLDVGKVAEAAESAGYRVEVQSHAWWLVRIQGDAGKIPEAFADVRGILKVERAGSEAKLLTLRTLPPDAILAAALKAGLKATPTRVR